MPNMGWFEYVLVHTVYVHVSVSANMYIRTHTCEVMKDSFLS